MDDVGFIEVNSRTVKRVKIMMRQRKEGLTVRGATSVQQRYIYPIEMRCVELLIPSIKQTHSIQRVE
jgi:hypothetical protein